MPERWEKHPRWLIEVSTSGRVRLLDGTPRKLKLDISSGYLQANIGIRGQNRRVHTLVLETYRGSRPTGKECRHLDSVKLHNQLGNLKWGTRKEQEQDKNRNGTYDTRKIFGAKNGMYKYSRKTYSQAFRLINQGSSYRAASRKTGISASRLRTVYLQEAGL